MPTVVDAQDFREALDSFVEEFLRLRREIQAMPKIPPGHAQTQRDEYQAARRSVANAYRPVEESFIAFVRSEPEHDLRYTDYVDLDDVDDVSPDYPITSWWRQLTLEEALGNFANVDDWPMRQNLHRQHAVLDAFTDWVALQPEPQQPAPAEDRQSPAPDTGPTWLGRPTWQGVGVIVTLALGIPGLILGYLAVKGPAKPPSVAEQIRAIEQTERATRHGSLKNLQPTLALHGDGTRSWVFEFAEQATSRLVVYDDNEGRLRKGIEVTNRVQMPPLPANLTFGGVPYRLLFPAQQREVRKLYTPRPVFDKPTALKIADGSQVLLVPTSVVTVQPSDPNSLRSTLVAVFWSADQGRYVLHRLSPVLDRWTMRVPTPLRLELRPGAGFEALPTATEVTIDKGARLVFATVGYVAFQVHAFRLPLSPDDLEECPAVWQGAAPTGAKKDVPGLERELSAGCPHV